MTESEWFTCGNDERMLKWLGKRVTRRKLRLFGCATARQVEHLIVNPINHEAVALFEEFADRKVTPAQARAKLRQIVWEPVSYHEWNIRDLAQDLETPNSSESGYDLNRFPEARGIRRVRRDWADALRDLFGPLPFRKVRLDPAWLAANDRAVTTLARTIYDERRWADVPILADALEDAGCADADLIGHCRGEKRHYRGCWVIDLILRKK